jgi:hypothetical protein
MKKRLLTVLSVILTFLMLGGTFAFAADVAPVQGDKFSDVPADSWFKPYVDFVAENAYMIGTSETTFEPQNNLTRAMFATILARYHKAKVDDSKETIFKDVPVNQWYTGSIGWNNDKGIVQGYGDGNFGTNDFITRQDLATMIIRYIPVYEKDYNKVHAKDRPMIDYEFTDKDQIADYAKDAIAKCVNYGLLEGYPDHSVKPTQNITRAETAAVIYRLAWLLKPNPNPNPGPSPSPVSSDKYKVNVNVAQATQAGKTRSIDLTAIYTESQAADKTVSQIAEDLVTGENETAIVGAFDTLISKAKEKGDRETTKNGYTISTKADGTIHVDGVDLVQSLQDETDLYYDQIEKAGVKAGVASASSWGAFKDAFSPMNAFDKAGEDLKLKSADDYYQVVLTAVQAAGKLYDEVAPTEDQFKAVLEAAEQAGADLGVSFEGNYKVLGTEVDSPKDLNDDEIASYLYVEKVQNNAVILDLCNDGISEVFSAKETVNSYEDVVDIVKTRISRDWSTRDDIKAVLEAVQDAYIGTYTVTVTVDRIPAN